MIRILISILTCHLHIIKWNKIHNHKRTTQLIGNYEDHSNSNNHNKLFWQDFKSDINTEWTIDISGLFYRGKIVHTKFIIIKVFTINTKLDKSDVHNQFSTCTKFTRVRSKSLEKIRTLRLAIHVVRFSCEHWLPLSPEENDKIY